MSTTLMVDPSRSGFLFTMLELWQAVFLIKLYEILR